MGETHHDSGSHLVPPLSDPNQICLREMERFDPFFSLTQSGGKTRVMGTPSFGSFLSYSHHPVLAETSPRGDELLLPILTSPSGDEI
ncbi:hypothetical protein Tco_0139746 [Tanacetum coccineum]